MHGFYFNMLFTAHHAKNMLNYEYFIAGQIMHIFLKCTRVGVGKYDEVIKYSAPILSSFLQCFLLNLCNNSDQS